MVSSISTLNSLLRGELAAVQTYDQALTKLGDATGVPQLRHIQAEHRNAAEALRQHIFEHGGEPDKTSGLWGTFARIVEGTAAMFGPGAALKALMEGEEHGIKQYQALLDEKDCPADCRRLIGSELLPQARTHVPVLDRLLAGAVERISAEEARRRQMAGALLICAYDSADKFRQNCLEGSIPLEAFQARLPSLSKDQELIFYCA